MPRYATLLCGSLFNHVDSVMIEGRTDDLGQEAVNLQLSQERSFRVMVKELDVIERDAQAADAGSRTWSMMRPQAEIAATAGGSPFRFIF